MKRLVRLAGILIAVVLLVAVAVPFLVDANQFRPLLETKLGQALGRKVTLGGLKLSLWSGSVEASDVSIADDSAFGATPFVRARSLKAGVELMPLIFSRKLNVTGITIDHPQIELVQNPAGIWNFSSLGAKSGGPAPAAAAPTQTPAAPPDLRVDSVRISDGRLTMSNIVSGAKTRPLVLDKVDIQVKNFSEASSFPFSLTAVTPGSGEIKLEGKAGPINSGNAAATPFQADLHVKHLDMVVSGVLDPAAGISGLASLDGTAGSDGNIVAVAGKLKAEQVKLVKRGVPAKKPVELDFVVSHDLKKMAGAVKRADIHLGGAAAALTGAYRISGEMPSVDLKLTGNGIPMTELAAFLPALDIALPSGASIEQGTGNLNLAAVGPLDRVVISGTVGLENTRLAKYDLASKLQVLHSLSGIKAEPHTSIQTFTATVRVAPDGTDVHDINMVVASVGDLTGAGTISPSHALDFKMRVDVKSAGVIPFTVQGTSEDPVIRPDVKGMATETLKQVTSGQTPPAVGAATDLINGLLGAKKKQQ